MSKIQVLGRRRTNVCSFFSLSPSSDICSESLSLCLLTVSSLFLDVQTLHTDGRCAMWLCCVLLTGCWAVCWPAERKKKWNQNRSHIMIPGAVLYPLWLTVVELRWEVCALQWIWLVGCVQQNVRLILDILGITTCLKHKPRPLTPSGFASRLVCDENHGNDEQQQHRRPDRYGQKEVVLFLGSGVCRQRMSVVHNMFNSPPHPENPSFSELQI